MATDASEADSDLCERVSLLALLHLTAVATIVTMCCSCEQYNCHNVVGYELDNSHNVVGYALDN